MHVARSALQQHHLKKNSAAAVFTKFPVLYGSPVTVRVAGRTSAAAAQPAEQQVVARTNPAPASIAATFALAPGDGRAAATGADAMSGSCSDGRQLLLRQAVATTVALQEGFCTEAAQSLG